MARFTVASIAKENFDETTNAEAAHAELTEEVRELQADSVTMDLTQNTIEDTNDDIEQIDTVGELLENTEDVGPMTASVVNVSVESICRRAGIKNIYSISKESRGNIKQDSVKQLTSLKTNLNNHLDKAQEGFIDNIKYKWSKLNTTTQKTMQLLHQFSAIYDSKTVKTDILKKPSFSKVINTQHKALLKSHDVAESLEKYYQLRNNASIKKVLEDMSDLMNDAAKEIDKNTLYANKENIDNLMDSLNTATVKLAELVTLYTPLNTNIADVEPLQKHDKDNMFNLVKRNLTSNELEGEYNKAINNIDNLFGVIWRNSNTRIMQDFAKDINLGRRIGVFGRAVINKVTNLFYTDLYIAHAATTYIKESVK